VVVIHGLQARPDLNGQTAEVCSFDETKQRYRVRLTHPREGSDRALLSLRPASLSLQAGSEQKEQGQPSPAPASASGLGPNGWPQGTVVVISGLQGRPDLNGQTAVVRSYSLGRQRYEVRLRRPERDGDAASKLLKPANLSLYSGQ
jgi:hypothetical protein